MAYGGEEIRNNMDMDWHQHKLKILGDLDDLKADSKETKKTVDEMSKMLTVLHTKIMVTVSLLSTAIVVVFSVAQMFLGG